MNKNSNVAITEWQFNSIVCIMNLSMPANNSRCCEISAGNVLLRGENKKDETLTKSLARQNQEILSRQNVKGRQFESI